jgi:hypothetical protein
MGKHLVGGSLRFPPPLKLVAMVLNTGFLQSDQVQRYIYKINWLNIKILKTAASSKSINLYLYIFRTTDHGQAPGRWFSPVSSTTKTGRYDIAENSIYLVCGCMTIRQCIAFHNLDNTILFKKQLFDLEVKVPRRSLRYATHLLMVMHRGCAGGKICTRFLRPRGTSPLNGVNPGGYRNGTESFFCLKGCPSVVRDV